MKVTIMNTDSKNFEKVTRLTTIDENKKSLLIDVHNDFMKFFGNMSIIGSEFDIEITDQEPILNSSISYCMKGYKLEDTQDKDIISFHGLLLKHESVKSMNSNSLLYCIVKV